MQRTPVPLGALLFCSICFCSVWLAAVAAPAQAGKIYWADTDAPANISRARTTGS